MFFITIMGKNSVRVGGVPEHFNTPWYLLSEEKPLLKDNIDVDFVPCYGGTGEMATALRNNELDIAVLLTEGITANILKGDDVSIVKIYVNSPLRWGIHVSRTSDILKDDEFEGHKFAISRPYSGSHLMAYVHAQKHNVELKDEDFVVIKNIDGARKSLANGESHYFLWEKFTTQPYVDNGEFRCVGECPTPWPCFVVAVRNEFLNENETVVAKILDEINRIVADLEADRENTIDEISRRFELKREQVADWFSQLNWNKDFELPQDVFHEVETTLHNLGVLKDADLRDKPAYLRSLAAVSI